MGGGLGSRSRRPNPLPENRLGGGPPKLGPVTDQPARRSGMEQLLQDAFPNERDRPGAARFPHRPGPGMMPDRPRGGGGAETMTGDEALQRSGLNTGIQARSEWKEVLFDALDQGLIRRAGGNRFLIGPDFWDAIERQFGGTGNNGGGRNDSRVDGYGVNVPLLSSSARSFFTRRFSMSDSQV